MYEQHPIPPYLADREFVRIILRNAYDEACGEMEDVNGLKQWIESGPSPEGYYHPIDIAHMVIEMHVERNYELGQSTIESITEWLVHA